MTAKKKKSTRSNNPVGVRAFLFFVPSDEAGMPIVNAPAIFQRRTYRYKSARPYKRKKDGGDSVMLTWETDCTKCSAAFQFETGQSRGFMRHTCDACRDARNAELAEQVQADRTVCYVPEGWVIHKAAAALYPRAMSMGATASRTRLYAPALMKKAIPELEHFTLAEVHEGIQRAETAGWIRWQKVGKNRFRQPLYGFWPRPAEMRHEPVWNLFYPDELAARGVPARKSLFS